MDFIIVALPVVFVVLVLLAIAVSGRQDRQPVRAAARVHARSDEPGRGQGTRLGVHLAVAQRGVRVDLRERFIEVPSQTSITKDNAPISIDFLIYWRIVDPYRSVVEVQNFEGALQNIATTTLRAVVGDILLDDVLSKRDQINEVLRVKLDEVTERWGGKVTTVEIREITPPRDVQDAMNRQLSAERTRRAVITESEGTRQSQINVAEGTKQSEILKAEGDRQAAILRAEGFALALDADLQAASRSTRRRWRCSTSRHSRRWGRAHRRSSSCRSRSRRCRIRSAGSWRRRTTGGRPRRADRVGGVASRSGECRPPAIRPGSPMTPRAVVARAGCAPASKNLSAGQPLLPTCVSLRRPVASACHALATTERLLRDQRDAATAQGWT